MSSTDPLPAGWYESTDPDTGDPYYYSDSGETSWTRPTVPATAAAGSDVVDEGASSGTFVRPTEEPKEQRQPSPTPQPTSQPQATTQAAAEKPKPKTETTPKSDSTPKNFVAAGSHPKLTGYLADLDKYIMAKIMAVLLFPATGLWGLLIWIIPQALWCAIEFISSIVYMANMARTPEWAESFAAKFYFLPVWLFLDSVAFAADIVLTLLFVLIGPGRDMVKNPPTILFTGPYALYESPNPLAGLIFTVRFLSLLGLRIFNVIWSFVGSIMLVMTTATVGGKAINWWVKDGDSYTIGGSVPSSLYDIASYTLTASWVFIFMQVTFVLVWVIIHQVMSRASNGEKDIRERPMELSDHTSAPVDASAHSTDEFGTASV